VGQGKPLSCAFKLTDRIVEVWCISTVVSSAACGQFFAVLNADERDRARQFRFDHLRSSFVAARGALRVLLGRYLNATPNCINFNYGSRGKPSLGTQARIQFNVSHSGALAVMVFTLDCDLGVDVEQIRPLPDIQEIATQFFCVDEAAELMSLTAHERERAFFLCWTRKEAYIKAVGDGLYVPLNSFRVTLRPTEPARLIQLNDNSEAAMAWSLHDLSVTSNYAAALAYRDALRPLRVLPVIAALELLKFAC
jgi:4'-phosphopantetheinyl transferase